MNGLFSVAVLIGSLRKESFSRKVAHALIKLQPPSLNCRIVEISDLPLYNQDLDDNPPEGWTRFRDEISKSDAVLFVTPEYNRSIPGCLKNATDIGSRPQGKSVFSGLAAGVVSVTPYKLGAFGANHAVRENMVFLDMPMMQQPEAYIANAGDLLDDNGALRNQDSKKLFTAFMSAFAMWIARTSRNASTRSFEAFMQRRREIAQAYVTGDANLLSGILPQQGPATFFSPQGDVVQGAQDIAKRYVKDAESFARGSNTRLEVLQSSASGETAWWTGYQFAEARMKGKDEPIHMKLRITEAFRFEPEGWKMVHRHAEPAKTA
jgi:NAD(P)H-dependent FMN reductase/ketosteroid isomerase-like protein